jgi:hypothetical protein
VPPPLPRSPPPSFPRFLCFLCHTHTHTHTERESARARERETCECERNTRASSTNSEACVCTYNSEAYVCMYSGACVCMYSGACVCIHAHAHRHVLDSKHAHTQTRTSTCTHTHRHVLVATEDEGVIRQLEAYNNLTAPSSSASSAGASKTRLQFHWTEGNRRGLRISIPQAIRLGILSAQVIYILVIYILVRSGNLVLNPCPAQVIMSRVWV